MQASEVIKSLILRYLSLSPSKQDLTQGLFLKWRFREEEIGHEPKLDPTELLLVIGSLS